jgi:hypothetical protein
MPVRRNITTYSCAYNESQRTLALLLAMQGDVAAKERSNRGYSALKQLAIKIYPNPAKEFVTIECKVAKAL